MLELTIQLQTDNDKCLYEQIYEYIQGEIKEGKLLQGERLPSTRSLAENLQVARSTVEMAYEQLLSEGYIESQPYRGYFVCKIEELFQLDEGRSSERKSSLEQAEPTGARGYTYDFSPTQIDMTGFPFSVWRRLHKKVLEDGNEQLYARGDAQGDYGFRETIARYLHASRGVNCTPEQIIVGAGNDYLLMLLEKILGKELSIAMENPTYKRAYRIFRSFAYPITTVDMDESGMMVEELRKTDAKLAYVMPSHQYPTGTVMPIGRRSELLKWANEKEDRYLIEDDYDSEFRYKGKPIPSLQASDKNGKVIYIGTFSKSIAPAIRVSYMVLPEKLVQAYREKCYFYSTTVSRIEQKILDEFIRGGYFERHLNKMRKYYRDKHDLLLEELKPFEKEFDITGENAGLHLLLTSKSGRTEAELIEKAGRYGVKIYGLSDSLSDSTKDTSYTVILGYGSLSMREIKDGVEALKQAWNIKNRVTH
ncbi:MAG: PLP-dependent aminotransferase family protein [Lachnospiraceae bacterium]|nr:PLP-dependent aminotransferase family protein [Lachnospiraceae bacterium]